MPFRLIPRRLRPRTIILLLLLGASMLLAAIYHNSIYHAYYHLKMRNFAEVVPGKIYRSALLRPDEVDYLVRHYGLRTIISLAGDVTPRYTDYFDAIARHENLLHVRVFMSSKLQPDPTDVTQVQTVMHSPTNWPVLVHCGAGADRTGWMIGIHRLLWDGWEWPHVKEEMKRHRCTFDEKRDWLDDFPTWVSAIAYTNNWDIPQR